MTVQCPQCELRFRSESEFRDHAGADHGVDPNLLEPLHYRAAHPERPLYPDLVEDASATQRVLVVANQTLRAERLHELLLSRAADRAVKYYVVVPATSEDVPTAQQITFATVGTVHPRERDLPAEARARHRLDEALARLRSAGLEVEGSIGSADPLQAVEDVLLHRRFDEIIVSTLARGPSRWLMIDLPTRLKRRFSLPVTLVSAA